MPEVSRDPRSQDAFWPVGYAGRKARRWLPGVMGRVGEPGTVAPGALADLVVVDGDPSASLRLLADANNVKAVLIDGKFVKDNLVTCSRKAAL